MKTIIRLSFVLIFFLSACQDDVVPSGGGDALGADEQHVEMSLSTSALSTTGNTLTRADEEVITLDLMVCKDGVYQYMRPAYSSDYATFRSTLKIDQDLDIYFFANCTSLLEEADFLVSGTTTWQQIQSRLHITSTQTLIEGKRVLPMWGQIKGVSISQDKVTNFGKVQLLRSVASANVYFKLQPGKGMKFEPAVAYVYFAADKAFMAPDSDNLILSGGQASHVTAPVSPADMRTSLRMEAQAVGDSIANSLYLFDNEAEGSASKNGNRRSRLVVGGYLENSQILTYYPLDFIESDNEDILQVTRNHRYNLIVTSVNSAGWENPDEAAEQASVNLDYKVISWEQNEDGDIAIDGPNYLSVSSKYVTLYRNKGSMSSIFLSGTYGIEDMSLSFDNSTNGTTESVEGGIKNSRFRVELLQEEDRVRVKVTAREEYSQAEPESNKDVLLIRAGRIEFKIHIEQITSKGWDNGGNENIDF